MHVIIFSPEELQEQLNQFEGKQKQFEEERKQFEEERKRLEDEQKYLEEEWKLLGKSNFAHIHYQMWLSTGKPDTMQGV